MATVLREPTFAPQPGRRPFAPDIPPNLPLSTLRPVVVVKPFMQTDWPVPARARPLSYDFQHSGVLTRGIPRPPPFSMGDFPTPMRARATPPDYMQAGYAAPSTGMPVGDSGVWPEIISYTGRDYLQLETTIYLPGPVAPPFIPPDLPTPMRARAIPQDFSFPSTGIPPAAPFKQADWPIFLPRRYAHQDFTHSGATTRGIPFGLSVPFSQNEWPVPIRSKLAYTESHASPRILLSTPVLRPFAQMEWVNPPRGRITPPDWQIGGYTTRGIPFTSDVDVTVPYLIGDTREAALMRIAGIYCVANVIGSTGTVTAQDPAHMTVVHRGTTITITLGGAPYVPSGGDGRARPPYNAPDQLGPARRRRRRQ